MKLSWTTEIDATRALIIASLTVNVIAVGSVGSVMLGMAQDIRRHREDISRLQLDNAGVMQVLKRFEATNQEQDKLNKLTTDILERLARKIGE